jgi:hypothetical protein
LIKSKDQLRIECYIFDYSGLKLAFCIIVGHDAGKTIPAMLLFFCRDQTRPLLEDKHNENGDCDHQTFQAR